MRIRPDSMNVFLGSLAASLDICSFTQHESHLLKDHKYYHYCQWKWLMFVYHFKASTNIIYLILKATLWSRHYYQPILHGKKVWLSKNNLLQIKQVLKPKGSEQSPEPGSLNLETCALSIWLHDLQIIGSKQLMKFCDVCNDEWKITWMKGWSLWV